MSSMEKGENYIVTKVIYGLYNNQLEISIPENKVVTYLEKGDNYMVFDVDGKQVQIFHGPDTAYSMRKIPYPLVKPSTISEYQRLFHQLVKDMEETLGVNHVVVRAHKLNVKITIGEPMYDDSRNV